MTVGGEIGCYWVVCFWTIYKLFLSYQQHFSDGRWHRVDVLDSASRSHGRSLYFRIFCGDVVAHWWWVLLVLAGQTLVLVILMSLFDLLLLFVSKYLEFLVLVFNDLSMELWDYQTPNADQWHRYRVWSDGGWRSFSGSGFGLRDLGSRSRTSICVEKIWIFSSSRRHHEIRHMTHH